MTLHTYTVHVKAPLSLDGPMPRFVQEGFSRGMLFLGPFWALMHRMVGVAVMLLLAEFILLAALGASAIGPVLSLWLFGCWRAMLASMADEIERGHLRRKGYALSGLTSGDTRLAAEIRYLDQVLGAA